MTKKSLGLSVFLLLFNLNYGFPGIFYKTPISPLSKLIILQNAHFTATASKTTLSVGEQFEITYTLDVRGKNFLPPEFRGFQVLSGPNESSNISYINGNISQSISYSYYLSAEKEGSYSLRPATILVNGQLISSNAITLKVVKGSNGQNGGSSQGGQNKVDSKVSSSSYDLSKDVFIKASVDKTQVWLGEQIIITFKLYTRLSLSISSIDKIPDFTGCWNQDVKQPNQNIQLSTEKINGQEFKVGTLKQTVLFPEHAGDIKVDPMIMTLQVRVQNHQKRSFDPFDPFGMDPFANLYSDIKYIAKSEPVKIHVKPLPEQGKPQSFTGAVGNFKIMASVDKKKGKTNEGLNYTITIIGKGNLTLLKEPLLNLPTEFEKFDPKITDSIRTDPEGQRGFRSFGYLLIPRKEGNYSFNPVNFSYFNPLSGKYNTLSTTSLPLQIEKGANQTAPTVYSNPEKQDIRMLDKDLHYIKVGDPQLLYKNGRFFNSFGYYVLFLIGFISFISGVYYKKYQEKELQDIQKTRSKRAGKVAARHLSMAEKELQTGNIPLFYENLSKGLYGFLSDRLVIPFANLNLETIKNSLSSKGYPSNLIEELSQTLNICEMARYAPMSNVSQKEIFEKSKSIIYKILETKLIHNE